MEGCSYFGLSNVHVLVCEHEGSAHTVRYKYIVHIVALYCLIYVLISMPFQAKSIDFKAAYGGRGGLIILLLLMMLLCLTFLQVSLKQIIGKSSCFFIPESVDT